MLLDIGVGILLGLLVNTFSSEYSTTIFVAMGVFATLAPDIDFIYHLIKGGNLKNDHRHREVLHQPVFLLVGTILFGLLFSPILGLVFALGVISHFIHDSIGIGWGVQWLYPFKTDHFTFFYRVHTANKPKPPKKVIYVWPNDKIDELSREYGDPDWVKNIYLKWHPFAIFELIVFVVALVVWYLVSRS